MIYPLFHITSVVVAFKTVSLILGAMITYFSFKAYRRTGARALGLLSVGFGVVTLGSLLAGVMDRLLQVPSNWALTAESGLTAVGFAIIVYSLYTR